MCPRSWPISYVPNPNSHPPANDAQKRDVRRLASRKAPRPPSAGDRTVSTFPAAMGPSATVTGAIARLGPGMPVSEARPIPPGYQMAWEKKGLMPDAIAWGHHASIQANILASPRPEPANRLAKWGSTGRPKSRNDASR